MKREIVIMLLSIIVLSVFGSTADGNVNSKVSNTVYDTIRNNGSANVMIKTSEPESSFWKTLFSIPQDNMTTVQNRVKEKLGENVSYSGDGLIYAKINSTKLKELETDSDIDSISPERVFQIGSQSPTAEINVSAVHGITFNGQSLTGAGQTICIIDTGVDYTHPDLGGCYGNNNASSDCKVLGGYDFVNTDSNPVDDNSHGTHVAGIATGSGNLTGVAPGAKIIAIKVCDASGSCAESNIQKGINWCVNNATEFNISVISLSLGTSEQYFGYCSGDSLESSVNDATAKNISVIAASGNDGNTTAMASPACIKNSTSVGDTYVQDYVGTISWGSPTICSDSNPALNQIVCHSNRDNTLDLLAPGALINSTVLSGSYGLKGGTSMAAPHVSGATAILKQYLSLNNRQLAPSELTSAFNTTGDIIHDPASGFNFSKIDVYSTFISIDEESPTVSLVSPKTETTSIQPNQTFECNATDILLKTSTIKIWNSTGLYHNATQTAAGQSDSNQFSANLTIGQYEWNCFYEDANNNTGFSSQNSTIAISSGAIYLGPANNTYTNTEMNFSCNSTYITGESLSNITFYVLNSSSSLDHNETRNITGNSNTTSFEYNLTTEGTYSWGCYFYTNESNRINSENYTVIYDITYPSVNLTSPPDGQTLEGGSQTINLSYNVTDNSGTANCVLLVDNVNVSSNNSITQTENNFSYEFSPGEYSWRINCTDLAGNSNTSQARSITIRSAQISGSSDSSSPSGSSGGSSSSGISTQKISGEYTTLLAKNYVRNFQLSDLVTHSIKINDLSEQSANITIESSPINFILEVGQDININLSSPYYYDLYVKLNNITNGLANITLRELTENNRIFRIQNETSDNSTNQSAGQIDFLKNYLGEVNLTEAIIFLVAIIGTLITVRLLRKRKRG